MVLLTAFKGIDNSSKILLDKINGVNVKKELLTNSFETCEKEIKKYISEYTPDYIISFGRKPVINRLYIEPTAFLDGVCIETRFDVSLLTDSLEAQKIPFKLSEKPTNYLCNHVYCKGLEFIDKTSANTQMIFIHVPDMKHFCNIDSVASWLSDFCRELVKRNEKTDKR